MSILKYGFSNQLVTSMMASAITYDAAADITYDGTNHYFDDAQGFQNASSAMTGYINDAARHPHGQGITDQLQLQLCERRICDDHQLGTRSRRRAGYGVAGKRHNQHLATPTREPG
jgi:hypothetical protein